MTTLNKDYQRIDGDVDKVPEIDDRVNTAMGEIETDMGTIEADLTAVQGQFNTSTGHDHDGVDSKAISHTNLTDKGTNTHSQIDTHISAANPHSNHATVTDLVAHATNTSNPHSVTAAQAGAAPSSQGVTNGNSHDHNGGDGAAIPEAALSLSDNTTANVSASAHGFCPKIPNNTTTFLRGDGTFATPAGGGDVSSNTATSVDGELALFNSTTGKSIKRATSTGIIKASSGVIGVASQGTDYYAPSGTDVAVADGGTGASTAAAAAANLSVVPNDGFIPYTAITPTRTTSDDPTYVLTFSGATLTNFLSVGMKVKWTQNSTVRYGIITALTSTTLTLYGGTDYDVLDTGTYTISNFAYSSMKAPFGFPLDPAKWTVEATDTSLRVQTTPTASTWYNLGSLTVSLPIGIWNTEYQVGAQVNDSTTGTYDIFVTLSTANNTESDVDMTSYSAIYLSSAGGTYFTRKKTISLASKTSYYLNTKTSISGVDNIYNRGDNSKTIIRATCAYL